MNAHIPKWHKMDVQNPPPARLGGALCYNPKGQTALLFGGTNSPKSYTDDFWSFNGDVWERNQVSLRPMTRAGASIVYDEAKQVTILFGGSKNLTLFGDMWVFDGIEWSQEHPQNAPSPRTEACMAYDAARNQTILFGGITNMEGKFIISSDEIWCWNGENWQQKLTKIIPPARSGASLINDRAHQSLVLFGGVVGGGLFDDTWTWDGSTWNEQVPSHRPPARTDFGMAYHEGNQQIVLFGGQSHGGLVNDTWIWNGKDWMQLELTQSPPPEVAYCAKMVYIPALQSIILFNTFREKTIISDERYMFTERSEVWVLDY